MRELHRRLQELEAKRAPFVTLQSSTEDICRYLAQWSVEELRASLPDWSEQQITEHIEMLQQYVPDYGREAA